MGDDVTSEFLQEKATPTRRRTMQPPRPSNRSTGTCASRYITWSPICGVKRHAHPSERSRQSRAKEVPGTFGSRPEHQANSPAGPWAPEGTRPLGPLSSAKRASDTLSPRPGPDSPKDATQHRSSERRRGATPMLSRRPRSPERTSLPPHTVATSPAHLGAARVLTSGTCSRHAFRRRSP